MLSFVEFSRPEIKLHIIQNNASKFSVLATKIQNLVAQMLAQSHSPHPIFMYCTIN